RGALLRAGPPRRPRAARAALGAGVDSRGAGPGRARPGRLPRRPAPGAARAGSRGDEIPGGAPRRARPDASPVSRAGVSGPSVEWVGFRSRGRDEALRVGAVRQRRPALLAATDGGQDDAPPLRRGAGRLDHGDVLLPGAVTGRLRLRPPGFPAAPPP